jgi:hypothetical protein
MLHAYSSPSTPYRRESRNIRNTHRALQPALSSQEPSNLHLRTGIRAPVALVSTAVTSIASVAAAPSISPVAPVTPFPRRLIRRPAEVDAQLTSVDDLLLQHFPRTSGASNIDEVCVSEASRLTGAPVNSNTDIHDIANVAEEVVQVLVRHLEGHVANEESLGRLGGRG